MAMLFVSRISKIEKDVLTVNDVSFSLQEGEKLAFAGETGSGKTTLLKMIAGLVQPDMGEVLFEGKRILGPYEKLIPGHPSIAYLSQHFELRNNYRVEEELESANQVGKEKAEELFGRFRISHLLKKKTNELSGGERQRIVLAKTILTSPRLLVLDEPFSNLDLLQKNNIKNLLVELEENYGTSFILVSHDAADTLSWADRIIVMQEGKIMQDASPHKVYHFPVDEYVAGLFGEYNILSAENKRAFGIETDTVRPEGLRITNDPDAVAGYVERVGFFGSYSMADVRVNDQLVKLRLNVKAGTGDRVFLQVNV